MKRKPRIYYSDTQKALIWDRLHSQFMVIDPGRWFESIPGSQIQESPQPRAFF